MAEIGAMDRSNLPSLVVSIEKTVDSSDKVKMYIRLSEELKYK